MRLDYDQLAEAVDRLVGTTDTVEDAVGKMGLDPAQVQNLDTVERAAPACASCAIRGFGSEMVDNPRGGKEHRSCV